MGVRCIAVTFVLLLAACGTGDAPSWAGSVDTLTTGVVRVRSPAEGVWGDRRGQLDETLRIGSVDDGGPDQLGHVQDVTVDDLGRLYVLEAQAKEVRVFGSDGRHVRTFARAGAGPGELKRPLALEWGPGGRLWIVDFGNRRYEVFDTTGAYVASHRLPTGSFGFSNHWGSEGLLHERIVEVGEGGRRTMTVRRRLAGDTLVEEDTFPVPETPEPETIEVTIREGDQAFTDEWPIPLAPHSVLAQDAAGGWWISDPGADYRIAELDLRGDTIRILERTYEPVPVSTEQRRAALEDLPEGTELSADRIPSVHPPVDEILPGRDDLWVKRRTAMDRTGYDVFGGDGRYLGELVADIPLDRLTLTDRRGDTAVGVLLGPLDVPYVVKLSVQYPGAQADAANP
jgi:hypothetical protein